MKLFAALSLLAISCELLACSSSSSSTGSGNVEVMGTLGTTPSFVPAEAIAYGAGGARFGIELSDHAGACVEAQSAVTKGGAASVSILLPDAVAGKTYPVDAEQRETGTYVSFDTFNPDCTSAPPGGYATGGHVTITAANEGFLSGTFELTFNVITSTSGEIDTITGSFVAPICAGVFEAAYSAQHITCR